jgi:hypothetical protein
VYPNNGLDIAFVANATGLADKFTRNWPIEVWWTCGPRFFHTFVGWAQGGMGAETGRVMISVITPGSDMHAIHRDLTGLPGPVTLLNPPHVERFGGWLVGHQKNDAVGTVHWAPTNSGLVPIPLQVNYSYGDVVTIQPGFNSGGVGRPEDLVELAKSLLPPGSPEPLVPLGDF